MQLSEPCHVYSMHILNVKRDNISTGRALKIMINTFSRYTNALENTIKQTGAHTVGFGF